MLRQHRRSVPFSDTSIGDAIMHQTMRHNFLAKSLRSLGQSRQVSSGEESPTSVYFAASCPEKASNSTEISCFADWVRNETGQFQCDVEPPVGVARDAPAELQCTVRVLDPSQFSVQAF